MKITPEQNKLLFQTVHCTGYLEPTHGHFNIEHNDFDNKWYFKMRGWDDIYAGVATDNISSWKHNRKFKFKEAEFSGVAVKLGRITVTIILGTYERENNIYFCSSHPTKKKGCSIIAATVYYRNGWKRIVPLDCIKEASVFNNGKNTKKLMNRLDNLIFEPPKNLITFNNDGRIEIENIYTNLNPENNELLELKRYLILDIRNRSARIYAEAGNEWFDILEEDYERIMNVLNAQIKEECGFIPDISYGETNFDRLVNFTRYPFAPELNELCKKEILGDKLEASEKELKYSPDGVKRFIQLTGLPYTQRLNKIFLQGHRAFTEYYSIWSMGFKDESLIEKIIDSDTNKIIASLPPYSKYNGLSNDVNFLFKFYDEKTVTKIIISFIADEEEYVQRDSLYYMKILSEEDSLPSNVIEKIGKEGFTTYNHDLLMRLYRDAHPDKQKSYENKAITYSDEEKHLEWENSGYRFSLPEDTNRLVDIGAKMNICVGHLYRDKAVNKECTIIYAKKDEEYELCIEVKKYNNRFHIVQKSAFNNRNPHGNELVIFKQWCHVKGVS